MSDARPWLDPSHDLTSEAALREHYELPGITSLAKEADHVHLLYRPFIEASPFAVLATIGPRGIDTSPRGDAPGFVEVADAQTLLLPDRRGNNRIDSLRNIAHDPRVALLFLIPGSGEALRVNGRARISAAPALLARFEVDAKRPRSVLVIAVQSVFFQCARAVMRSGLWDSGRWPDLAKLPTAGSILGTLSAELGGQAIDGAAYDAALRARQRGSLY
jgi:PPOX class probable FMN-dependent enzyme